jgi:hypothetical protein
MWQCEAEALEMIMLYGMAILEVNPYIIIKK